MSNEALELAIAIFFGVWAAVFILGSIAVWFDTTKRIAKNPHDKYKLNDEAMYMYLWLVAFPFIVFIAVPAVVMFSIQWCSKKLQEKYIKKYKGGDA